MSYWRLANLGRRAQLLQVKTLLPSTTVANHVDRKTPSVLASPPASGHVKMTSTTSTPPVVTNGNQTPAALPDETRVVICGGGVIGASVAYHLADRGWTDVLLLEQGSLSGGTTWHAAGLVARPRRNPVEMKLVDYSRRLYQHLEEADYGTGFKQCGSLNLARTATRLTDIKRLHDVARAYGIESYVVNVPEIQRLCPILRTDDLLGGFWIPEDGVTNPTDVCVAMTKVAREKGVKVHEKVRVKQVITEGGKVKSVETSHGDVKCDVFVNCAGQWARQLGQQTTPLPVDAPLHSCQHFYVVTKPQEAIDRMMPVIRDYDGYVYIREWNGGVLAGGFEPQPKTCFHSRVPDDFEFQLLPDDWDQFQILMENALHRMPYLQEAEVRQLTNGPESFTPDSSWLLGPSPTVKNYFLAAGLNSRGIQAAGGVGKYLAECIVDGHPTASLWGHDPRRLHGDHNGRAYLRARVPEAYGYAGAVKLPNTQYQTGRDIRCSPLHARLGGAGAVFGEAMGYERPLVFEEAADGTPLDPTHLCSWQKPSWFQAVRAEHRTCKQGVGLADVSSLAKFEVTSPGPEATAFLQHLCSSDVDMPVGSVTYTGMLNVRGGFENFCTVARTDASRYFITCIPTQQVRCLSWLRFHLPPGGAVRVDDVTSGISGVTLIGPQASQLLADVSGASTSHADFPPMTLKSLDLGYARGVNVMRVTNTGEDGFVVFASSESLLHIYDTLMKAGLAYGIRNVGHYAMRHLQVENSFPEWGIDLDEETTPLECGPGFGTKLESKSDFLGKAALLKQREQGVGRRFTQFMLDDFDVHKDNWPWGGEPIYRDGKFVGVTTTCGFGYSTDKTFCLGFVGDLDADGKAVSQGDVSDWTLRDDVTYQVMIAGQAFPARPKQGRQEDRLVGATGRGFET